MPRTNDLAATTPTPARMESCQEGWTTCQWRSAPETDIQPLRPTELWIEVGWRAYDKGSATDHGAAKFSVLIAAQVGGQTMDEFRLVSTLDEYGNLLTTADYRAVDCGRSWSSGLVLIPAASSQTSISSRGQPLSSG